MYILYLKIQYCILYLYIFLLILVLCFSEFPQKNIKEKWNKTFSLVLVLVIRYTGQKYNIIMIL